MAVELLILIFYDRARFFSASSDISSHDSEIGLCEDVLMSHAQSTAIDELKYLTDITV